MGRKNRERREKKGGGPGRVGEIAEIGGESKRGRGGEKGKYRSSTLCWNLKPRIKCCVAKSLFGGEVCSRPTRILCKGTQTAKGIHLFHVQFVCCHICVSNLTCLTVTVSNHLYC